MARRRVGRKGSNGRTASGPALIKRREHSPVCVQEARARKVDKGTPSGGKIANWRIDGARSTVLRSPRPSPQSVQVSVVLIDGHDFPKRKKPKTVYLPHPTNEPAGDGVGLGTRVNRRTTAQSLRQDDANVGPKKRGNGFRRRATYDPRPKGTREIASNPISGSRGWKMEDK